MAAVDDLTGLIAPVVAAGVVMKVTEGMFGSVNRMQQQQAPARRTKKSKRSRRTTTSSGFGDFSNVGF